MPKSLNIKKSAAAQAQSIRAIQKVLKSGDAGAWMSVQKALGNGYFLLRNKDGRETRGTPRGLFTCGNMRISVGQIVVVEGDMKIGVEIVGAVRERREAEQYARKGQMPKEVLNSAMSIGGSLDPVEEEDFFEAPEAEEEVRGKRSDDTQNAISSRVAMLLSGTEAEVDVDAI